MTGSKSADMDWGLQKKKEAGLPMDGGRQQVVPCLVI